MNKKSFILVFLVLCLQKVYGLEDQEMYVSRTNNYNLELTPTWVYQTYSVESDTDKLIITHSRNSSSIRIDFIVTSNIDYSKIHGIFVKTLDIHENIIENATIYIYVMNLTNAEIKSLLAELEIAEGQVNDSNTSYDDLWEKYNDLLDTPKEKDWMDENGTMASVVVVSVCLSITFIGGFLFIPAIFTAFKKYKNQKRKNEKLDKLKKEAESNLHKSEYNMNPKIKVADSENERWVDLQPPHQLKALEDMDPNVNYMFYVKPPQGLEYNDKTSSTLDIVKYLLQNHDTFKDDIFNQKVFLDAFCDYLAWAGETEKLQIHLKNCTFKDIDNYRAEIAKEKEKLSSGDPTKQKKTIETSRSIFEKEYEEITSKREKEERETFSDSSKTAGLFK